MLCFLALRLFSDLCLLEYRYFRYRYGPLGKLVLLWVVVRGALPQEHRLLDNTYPLALENATERLSQFGRCVIVPNTRHFISLAPGQYLCDIGLSGLLARDRVRFLLSGHIAGDAVLARRRIVGVRAELMVEHAAVLLVVRHLVGAGLQLGLQPGGVVPLNAPLVEVISDTAEGHLLHGHFVDEALDIFLLLSAVLQGETLALTDMGIGARGIRLVRIFQVGCMSDSDLARKVSPVCLDGLIADVEALLAEIALQVRLAVAGAAVQHER